MDVPLQGNPVKTQHYWQNTPRSLIPEHFSNGLKYPKHTLNNSSSMYHIILNTVEYSCYSWASSQMQGLRRKVWSL